MRERDYLRAVEAVKSDCEAKLHALAVSWTLLNGTPPPKQPSARKVAPNSNGDSLGATLAAIVASPDMPAEFNTLDIDTILRKERPDFTGSRSSVTHTLKRMADGKSPLIRIIEVGKGKRATKYRKTNVAVEMTAMKELEDLLS